VPGFTVLETFATAPLHLISGIGRMLVMETQGGPVLYAATRGGGGLTAFDISGGMALVDQESLISPSQLPAEPSLDVVLIGGQPHLVASGLHQTTLLAYQLDGDGMIGGQVRPAGGPVGVISAQAMAALQGGTQMFAALANDGAVRSYRMAPDGSLTLVQTLVLAPGVPGVNIAGLATLQVGGATFLAAASPAADRISLMRVASDGGISLVSSIGAADGLGIGDPTGLSVVAAHGTTWLAVASGASSSISLIAVAPDGGLRVTDHLVDTLDTRFQGVRVVETFTCAGRAFVLAGGGDRGLTLFEILPDGRMVLSAMLLDDPALALDGIGALALRQTATGVEVFVAGEGTGITRLTLDLTGLAAPVSGGAGNDSLTGGAGHDLLSGGAGDDSLTGGAGGDVLQDGSCADQLWGGAGADLFVLAADGAVDVIRDFQPGIDRIDLSAWGRVYDLAEIAVTPMPWGARLQFGTEVLDVCSANGLPLSLAQLDAAGLFDLWHAVGPLRGPDGTFMGHAGADFIEGGTGNDLFLHSAGNDTLVGGAGFDTLDLGGADAGSRVDLALGRGETGAAAGQTYLSIEAALGSAFDDVLLGGAGANLLDGRGGNDLLQGRAGDDQLAGGDGDDTLQGGPGADVLQGGAGVDWAVCWNAAAGVRVDLVTPAIATGEAAGDRFFGIENLAGSFFADTLAGDALANRIDGLAGNDVLTGRAGSDTLVGGDGADTLQGGLDSDMLHGGAGVDWAVYWNAAAGVRADLTTPADSAGEAAGDVFVAIENLAGSFLADTLAGDALANRIDGLAGNDLLLGRAGNDTLVAADGDDTLEGGAGADALHGGAGADWAVYWDAAAGVRADLTTAAGSVGEAAGDLFTAIENLAGSSFADTLLGDALANRIDGLAGNDLLLGRAGSDTLVGGDGADTLQGGTGADALHGGAGVDWAVYWNAAAGVRADLTTLAGATGDAAGDRFFGVENLAGSYFADTLAGDALANRIDGLAGNDVLTGRAGNDTLVGGDGADTLQGGAGNDILWGGAGADTFVISAGEDRIMDFQRGVDLIRLDAAMWGGAAMTVAEVLAHATVDLTAAILWLELGSGHRLAVHGITDPAQLSASLTIA